MKVGDTVLVNTLGRDGTVIDKPWWYGGDKQWEYYVELEPWLVAGVMADELEPQESAVGGKEG